MANFAPLLVIFVLLASSGNRIVGTDIVQGRLPPCPETPNCVSSQSSDKKHAIAPLRYEGRMEEARQRLLEVIKAQEQASTFRIRGNHIHAEFTSSFLRFVDDVNFVFDDNAKIIHVRSASRVGYFDLGVNRRRIEKIRSQFDHPSKGGN